MVPPRNADKKKQNKMITVAMQCVAVTYLCMYLLTWRQTQRHFSQTCKLWLNDGGDFGALPQLEKRIHNKMTAATIKSQQTGIAALGERRVTMRQRTDTVKACGNK